MNDDTTSKKKGLIKKIVGIFLLLLPIILYATYYILHKLNGSGIIPHYCFYPDGYTTSVSLGFYFSREPHRFSLYLGFLLMGISLLLPSRKKKIATFILIAGLVLFTYSLPYIVMHHIEASAPYEYKWYEYEWID